MNRFGTLRELLQKRIFFKLVCGAGNEDLTEVRRLATVYTLAGAHMHDLSANPSVVEAAQEGIERAYRVAGRLGKNIPIRPYLNVSIGIKGDPHVRKAKIDKDCCTMCAQCIEMCRQTAIGHDFIVREYKCIGCGDCENICPSRAVQFVHRKADFDKILPECRDLGVETMELHAVTTDDEAVMHDWRLLNGIIRDNFISVCLDRSLLSSIHLIERIKALHGVTGERMIVQADGVSMSGEGDDCNTTLQAVACADTVLKSGLPVPVLLSGGTNSKTGMLATMCGVKAHGVAIGSFARKIVREYVCKDDFDSNINTLKKAVAIAELLIRANTEALHG